MKENRNYSWRLLALVAAVILSSVFSFQAYSAESMALAGIVSSDKEPQMEGVLVSAKKVGGTITVTVVSDSHGRYAFPANRLQPGEYRLNARATGFDLEDPGVVTLAANKTKEANLKLQPTRDLTSQITNAEWLASAPGSDEDKKGVTCMVGCHQLAVVAKTKYDADALKVIMARMRNYAAASINEPGDWVNPVPLPYEEAERSEASQKTDARIAEYLSTINLSSSPNGKWNYEFKAFPRLKGASTKIIITEYDLPRRGFEPHDVVMDPDGMIWTPDFGNGNLGRLNPTTGEFKEWKVPTLKPDSPAYGLDLAIDKDGNPWFSMMEQGGISKFDRKTQTFSSWRVPPAYDNVKAHVGMVAITRDSKVWFKDSRNNMVHRLDPQTNHYDSYKLPHEFYGMRVDSIGDLILSSLSLGTIAEIDAETGKITDHPTPSPNSGAHRGEMDSKDRYWFAESNAGKIGMFDTKTKKIEEWPLPFQSYSDPYDAVADKKGDVWAAGMLTDYVFRLNPQTGQVVTYLLPTHEANIRRLSVDNSTGSVGIWMGENHHARIAKLEPLE